jgi:hypothetical protein
MDKKKKKKEMMMMMIWIHPITALGSER